MMGTTTRAIDNVQHCTTKEDVRRHIDALDDVLAPLLVQRGGYMTQAARIKHSDSQVRDEERIEAIVARVRVRTEIEGGAPEAVIEAAYRAMIDASIEFEHGEFKRLRQQGSLS